MAQSAPLITRLLASSVTAASRAGKIVRDVMSKGELGIVEKVSESFPDHVEHLKSVMCYKGCYLISLDHGSTVLFY